VSASYSGGNIIFSLDQIDQVFDPNESEIESFKNESFRSNGAWLNGRAYDSEETLMADLRSVSSGIAKYGIINQKGFDRYRIKALKYDIAKAASQGPVKDNPSLFLILTYGLCVLGAAMYILPKVKVEGPPGIKNNGIFNSVLKNRGWLGILTGTFLIVFYIFLYYYPQYMTNWIITVDPVSLFLKNSPAGAFFLYGFIYTLCILVMGVRMAIKYRHSKYQLVRTASVMFFQTAFAFLIPEILVRLNKPYFDFKNIWPLDYDFFFDNELSTLLDSGSLGVFMLGWGIALIIIGVPIFVYFFGKRWYCSWVCGCGGLAETLGDPFRQLSDKSLKAWKVERWMVHGVLAFAIIMTAGVLYTYFSQSSEILGINTYSLREHYGAWIGAGFAGVIGTGFYPFMGNRVWCRFGCPLAAYLGLVQRFKSRFRITTNGGQCISCGNCSTYCEMGIDVRWYAQRGQNIVRSSCVGCGICSSVCPRGVLNLENKAEKGRLNKPILIGNDSLVVNSQESAE
ncbi:MAG: 4Fe-4S binding protein, partial [Cyclobacteriaceae bacterium]